MWADSTGGTTFTLQGTALETTHNSTSWFGVWCKHTSSNNDNYFFDDFNVSGQIFVDTTAPALVSLNPTSTTTLEVQFTESVDPTTAQNVNNYSADNGLGNPISATIDGTDPAQVNLVFGSAFQNGVNYSLTVSNVEDLFSNAMTTASLPFSFFSSPPAAFQDVVINEIFPDPSPPVALPEEEFLELFNASSETFDLSGWEYSDASTTVTLPSYVLAPGDHLILCAEADTALFSPFGNVLGLGSWPTLNNTGDNLSLRDNQGTLIDQANYALSWYRDPSKESGGFSLERINPLFDCGGAGNWIGSPSFDGGTPGVQNAAFDTLPDVVQPNLTTIIVNSTFQITVNFDEGLDSTSLATASFVVDNGATVSNFTPNPPAYESVTLDFSAALSTTTLYSLTINGASDCWGNTLNNNQGTFGIGEAPTTPFQLVINEIFPDPDASLSSLPEGEFVEIYNRSDDLLNHELHSILRRLRYVL
ncbi:MAG: lamin tail domain-containing protein [Bacteroidota bacterium]